MNGYEPRFDRDYAYGHQGELLVADMLQALKDGHGRVETKTKRRLDDRIYVEIEQDPGGTDDRWKDSGLTVTEAEWWAYSINNTGMVIFIPTDLLRWARAQGAGRLVTTTEGDNPTRGWLFRLAWLIQELDNWQHS